MTPSEELTEILLHAAASRYGTSGTELRPLPGGHFTQVYEFTREGRACVLRITPPDEEVDRNAIEATLDWMSFLAENGCPVPSPLRSREGRLIESVPVHPDGPRQFHATAFEKARGVLSETLSIQDWTDELYRSLGQAVGRMHALAARYTPPSGLARRPHWDACINSGNCFTDWEECGDPAIDDRRARTLAAARALPRDAGSYGLVHLDLHFGNIYVDLERCAVTLFDFDDCAYGWYAMDLAMLLFDALVLVPADQRESFAPRFFETLLRGYRGERELSSSELEPVPLFLKLLEINLYSDVHRSGKPVQPDTWPGRFMPGRAERIVRDVPYVDLDLRRCWDAAC